MTTDLSWFVPTPKQQAFIQANEFKELVYAGGFGSGKTLAGGFKALKCCLEHPGTVGLVGRETARTLNDTTKKVLVDGDDKPPIIPPEFIAYRNDSDNRVILKNGSEILFRSFQDFNVSKVRSLNLGWVYIDECTETTEKIWDQYVGRLRHPAGPRIAWGTTNPNGHDWVWRRFHPEAGVTTRPLFVSRTEENIHLPPDYVAHLRTMPKEWQKRFLDCSFDTAAGMIWDEWDRNVHVLPEFEIPYNWRRFESLDHGRRNPTAYLQWAVDFDGNVIVSDGYYAPGLVSQHAAAIVSARGSVNTWKTIIADPSCWVAGADARAVVEMYLEHGLSLVRASNNVDAGLLRVSEWLTRREGELFPDWHPFAGTLGPDGDGSPRLFVFDNKGTSDLRREISDYRWKDLSASQERDRDQPEEPRKKDDHACDALRYGLMSQPRPAQEWQEPEARGPGPKQDTAGIRSKTF